MQLDESTLINFLTVKSECTIDELVNHINLVYSHFDGPKFSKSDIEKSLIQLCQADSNYYLEKIVDSTQVERQVWKIIQNDPPIHKKFPYGSYGCLQQLCFPFAITGSKFFNI